MEHEPENGPAEPEHEPPADDITYGYEVQHGEGWEPAPEPVYPEARRGRAGTVALALALVVSLAGNVLLGARFRDERDTATQLRAEQQRLHDEIDSLRSDLGQSTGVLAAIARSVERIRGLTFKTSVEPHVLSLSAFKARVRDEIEADADPKESRATQTVLRLLGVIPKSYDLARETRAIQEEQVGGFYDNKAKELVVPAVDAKDPSPLDREVLAHEFTHALTDQHYDLARLDRLRDEQKDDESAAFVALAEGDAEAVRSIYDATVLTDAERADIRSTEIETKKFEAAPPFLQDVFLFPYVEGTAFVAALRNDGGFDRVNRAYADPPTSTEQILHPERYLDHRDEPVAVTLPDVRASLGTGWSALDTGEVGELDLRLIAQYGGAGVSTRKANAAAAGWDGGAYAAFDSSKGALISISTAWDSGTEADEAVRLFGEWLPTRFQNAGTAFAVNGGTGWSAKDGAGAVFRSGSKVVLVLGPDRGSVEAANRAF